MKKAIFHLKRDSYQEETTLGTMYSPNGEIFGYTLEDIVRPYGIKDKHWTAIPETKDDFTYQVETRVSGKYGEVAVVFTEKEESPKGTIYRLKHGGISFSYILVHGGNDDSHTSGCILLAKNRNTSNRTIQGTLKTAFMKEVKRLIAEGYSVELRVTNLPQAE